MRDYDANVSARSDTRGTDWVSNFPDPIFDRDDDDADYRYEEAEVTADSTTFPTAGTTYYFDVRWSRWRTIPRCCNVYDPDSGRIGHASQISWRPCITFEWDTYRNDGPYAYTNYPYVAGPVTAAPTIDSAPVAEAPSPDLAAPPGAAFVAAPGGWAKCCSGRFSPRD